MVSNSRLPLAAGANKAGADDATRQISLESAEEKAKPASDRTQLRYFAAPIPSGQEIEVAGYDVKVSIPEGCHGYSIKSKEVKVENGIIRLEERGVLSNVYIGKEYNKSALEEEGEKLKARLAKIEKLMKSMGEKNLERIVEAGGKIYGLLPADKVYTPEEYKA